MMIGKLFFFASRLLFGKKDSGSRNGAGKGMRGAVAGIALSLVPLVVVFELADGMIEGIMTRNVELSSYHIQASAPSDIGLEDLKAAAVRARGDEDVAFAFAERQGLGVALGPEDRGGASIRAIEPAMLAEDPAFARLIEVRQGSLSLPERNSAILGSALAEKLGVRAGDRVSLLTLRSGISGRQGPRLSSFKVSGVVSSGYQEIDALWFIIGLDYGSSLLSRESQRAFVGIKLKGGMGGAEGGIEPGYYPGLRAALGKEFELVHWSSLLEPTRKSLLTTKTLLILIAALIVIVAAVNVSSAVIMLVIERRQDIAVLKSLGASQSGVTAVFTAAGAFIGVLATALGTAAGLFMSVNINANIRILDTAINVLISLYARMRGVEASPFVLLDPRYYLVEIPVRIEFPELLAAGCAAIFLSAFAAWASAQWRTKSIPPLDVLRRA
jgi:lipoprotein-releasing system permease protein